MKCANFFYELVLKDPIMKSGPTKFVPFEIWYKA